VATALVMPASVKGISIVMWIRVWTLMMYRPFSLILAEAFSLIPAALQPPVMATFYVMAMLTQTT